MTHCDTKGNVSLVLRNYGDTIPDYLIKNNESYKLADKLYRVSKKAELLLKFKCKITDSVFIEYENLNDCGKIIKHFASEDINTIRVQVDDKLIGVKDSKVYDFKITNKEGEENK